MTQEPLAASYVPVYQALRDDWKLVLLDETAILDEISHGPGRGRQGRQRD